MLLLVLTFAPAASSQQSVDHTAPQYRPRTLADPAPKWLPKIHPDITTKSWNPPGPRPAFFSWHRFPYDPPGCNVNAGPNDSDVCLDLTPPTSNQGACGACWAFGATSLVESMYRIRNYMTFGSRPPVQHMCGWQLLQRLGILAACGNTEWRRRGLRGPRVHGVSRLRLPISL
jgi:hypothetical protein